MDIAVVGGLAPKAVDDWASALEVVRTADGAVVGGPWGSRVPEQAVRGEVGALEAPRVGDDGI